jgi:hypothetical protein
MLIIKGVVPNTPVPAVLVNNIPGIKPVTVLRLVIVVDNALLVIVPVIPVTAATEPNSIFLSSTVIVDEFTVTVVPLTVKLPPIVVSPVVVNVVNAPVLAVVAPIGPGAANVEPFNELAFKLATTVFDATINGAVPAAIVDSTVVNLPVLAVVEPSAPGAANVEPFNELAFKLATLVVDATINGAVPIAIVDVICPFADIVVNAPDDAVVAPIVPVKSDALIFPFAKIAHAFVNVLFVPATGASTNKFAAFAIVITLVLANVGAKTALT